LLKPLKEKNFKGMNQRIHNLDLASPVWGIWSIFQKPHTRVFCAKCYVCLLMVAIMLFLKSILLKPLKEKNFKGMFMINRWNSAKCTCIFLMGKMFLKYISIKLLIQFEEYDPFFRNHILGFFVQSVMCVFWWWPSWISNIN
jgi:hypothetical protein